MELGTFQGWSTTWILRALRDNGHGHLHSFDQVDAVLRTVPADLADGRWTFVPGDVAANLARVPRDLGYLFVDADHGRRFARWYLAHLFPLVAAGTPVSVHDVFHLRWARPWSEGTEVLRWLAERDTAWFTAARRHAPATLGRPRRGARRDRAHRRPRDDGEPDDLLQPAIRSGRPNIGNSASTSRNALSRTILFPRISGAWIAHAV